MEPARTAVSVIGACAFALTFVPFPLRSKVDSCLRDLWEKVFSTTDPFSYIEVTRKHRGFSPLYEDLCLYLGSLNIEYNTRHVSVDRLDRKYLEHNVNPDGYDAARFVFSLPLNETLVDTFDGAHVIWKHEALPVEKDKEGDFDENPDRVFRLTMLKSEKRRLLRPYLHHIFTVAHEIRQRTTLRALYTNCGNGLGWTRFPFEHPSTFHTIALDGNLAECIQADLQAFSESEAYYHGVGRTWKRGYLLYGPPGTGKSSLIAAIANFMRYDIYDLELTSVRDNDALKNLLVHTKRKSVIVIEDIDCSMSRRAFGHREEPVEGHSHTRKLDTSSKTRDELSNGLTLSGLLNFADGLLSCCGEERIFIFTTNHKERLDPALLRCGRMDMHILLSYCSFSAFKKLAFNYLGIQTHALYGELEEALRPGVKITPASIAEILISERKDPDSAMMQAMAAIKAAEPINASDKGHQMDVMNA